MRSWIIGQTSDNLAYFSGISLIFNNEEKSLGLRMECWNVTVPWEIAIHLLKLERPRWLGKQEKRFFQKRNSCLTSNVSLSNINCSDRLGRRE